MKSHSDRTTPINQILCETAGHSALKCFWSLRANKEIIWSIISTRGMNNDKQLGFCMVHHHTIQSTKV